MRQSALDNGINIASFQWVMQCLMRKERLPVDGHISYQVRHQRNTGELVWLKRSKKSKYERAFIQGISGSSTYTVGYLRQPYGPNNGITEDQFLHCDEINPTHPKLPKWVGASMQYSRESVRDYSTFTLHNKYYTIGDTCIMTDGRIGTISRLWQNANAELRMRWQLLSRYIDEENKEDNTGYFFTGK